MAELRLVSAMLGCDHRKVIVEAGGGGGDGGPTHTFDFEVHVAAGTEMCDYRTSEARMDPCRWR